MKFMTAVMLVVCTGCTSGRIVDVEGHILDLNEGGSCPSPASPTLVKFIPIDAIGHLEKGYGTKVSGAAFSFDPLAESGKDVLGLGVNNQRLTIPEGDYYVAIGPGNCENSDIYASPMFHHSYYATCSDPFTNSDVACAQYDFKIYPDESWPDGNPPTEMHDGIRVVPFLTYRAPQTVVSPFGWVRW